MNKFEYVWPVKVYFGENTVKEKLESELKNWGRNIMLSYGGGSIKKNGIYDEIMEVIPLNSTTFLSACFNTSIISS